MQDFVVNNVRRALSDAVSSFDGCMENGDDLARLIEQEFEVLLKALYLHSDSKESNYGRVAVKLLNLYRTGRLGHYTLDPVPRYCSRDGSSFIKTSRRGALSSGKSCFRVTCGHGFES
ncbi:hypothetical protein OROHE_024579 [Orobanche hederae]